MVIDFFSACIFAGWLVACETDHWRFLGSSLLFTIAVESVWSFSAINILMFRLKSFLLFLVFLFSLIFSCGFSHLKLSWVHFISLLELLGDVQRLKSLYTLCK